MSSRIQLPWIEFERCPRAKFFELSAPLPIHLEHLTLSYFSLPPQRFLLLEVSAEIILHLPLFLYWRIFEPADVSTPLPKGRGDTATEKFFYGTILRTSISKDTICIRMHNLIITPTLIES